MGASAISPHTAAVTSDSRYSRSWQVAVWVLLAGVLGGTQAQAGPLTAAAGEFQPAERALSGQERSFKQLKRTFDEAERQRLWQAHLQSMAATLQQLQQLRPSGRMSLEQLRDWMTEHQRLMERLMGQMMQEHEFLMQGVPCPSK